MDRSIDDIVKSLLKFVVRGFYGGSFVLVIDAILFHSVLAEEDLKQLLNINKTELGPLIARLRNDRLITTHKQREYPPNSKSIERCYYYIKYPQAVDGIKWKVHQVVQRLKDDLDKNSAPNGYMCPICETKYTQLEAVQLLNYDRTEFLCSLCEEPLVEDDSNKKNKEKQDKLNTLMDQIQPIIDYLKKIDDSRIEEHTFEIALARLIPPQNQSNAAYTYNPKKGSTMFNQNGETHSIGNENSKKAGVNSQATLHINITTANDEVIQRQLQERQAEEKRKQNAVPEWHKQSTIGKSDLGKLDDDEMDNRIDSTINNTTNITNNNISNNISNNNNFNGPTNSYRNGITHDEMEDRENERTLAEYYAQLAKKQEKENNKETDNKEIDIESIDEDEFDEEFEDEFEDVTDEKTVNDNRPDASNKAPIQDSEDKAKTLEENFADDDIEFEDV